MTQINLIPIPQTLKQYAAIRPIKHHIPCTSKRQLCSSVAVVESINYCSVSDLGSDLIHHLDLVSAPPATTRFQFSDKFCNFLKLDIILLKITIQVYDEPIVMMVIAS